MDGGKAAMTHLGTTRKIQVAVLLLFAVVMVCAKSSGPDRGYTGAPGDNGSCIDCHDTFHQVNVGAGSVRITGNPAVYQPGETYTLSITIQDPSRKRWGFQLTAIDPQGLRAGKVAPLGPDTQIAQTGVGAFDRQYIEHSTLGSAANTSGGHTWQIQWTAPSIDSGTVQFYAAGNAANNDGTNQGDYIYTTSAISESPASFISLSFVEQPEGMTLVPGTKFTVRWNVTNTSNVDSYDVRYSTDDGMTFPVTNLIFSTTDPMARSAEWTVPDISTSQARIRVQAATKQGAVAEIKTGRFAIGSGAPAVPRPRIASALISGNHLLVFGENFQTGAVVEMSGADLATTNDKKDPTRSLKCKKAAKLIAAGATVPLVVRNPDSTRSDPFPFTR